MIRRFSTWLMTHRFIVLGAIAVITLFFVWQMRNLEVRTLFEDLLPVNHPYAKIHRQYEEQLGNPLKVLLMLQVKEGDIYNYKTLEKAVRITEELDGIPGVNHNQIYSIASRKAKKITVNVDGIVAENLMDEVPNSKQALEAFKEIVYRTKGVYGTMVSFDDKAALFTATFIPESGL